MNENKDELFAKCTCGLTPINKDEKVDITSMKDCPYCGIKFDNPAELFNHVFIFHSSC
ncbi:hypothetical protein MCHI_003758 [Candidatus Magnetoovum chiemensis]|nr:hypothetical protein MCHI_003758 [Candidatus Magnetoovum chiemensis]